MEQNTSSKNNKKVFGGIFFGVAIVLMIFAILTIVQIKSCKSNNQPLDTLDAITTYLKNNSNLFEVLEEQKDFWPRETLTLDLTGKKILHSNDNTSQTDTIRYEDIPNCLACKKLTDQDSKNKFRLIIGQFDSLLKDSAINADIQNYINTYGNQDKDTIARFSRLYNILAGDTLGHIIVGKKNNSWYVYRIEDFPLYILNQDVQFYSTLIQHHKSHPKDSLKACPNAKAILRLCNMYEVYYDFRHNKVIEQDNQKLDHSSSSLQNDLNTIKTYTGWLNYYDTNMGVWKSVAAKEYYTDAQNHFVNASDDWLEKIYWTDKQALPSWLAVLLGILAVVFAGLGGGMRKIANKTESKIPLIIETGDCDGNLQQVFDEKSDKGVTSFCKNLVDKLITWLRHKKEEPNEELAKIKAALKEKEKQYEQQAEELKSLKKQHNLDIEQAKKDAVIQYKKDNNIKNLADKADNWDNLLKITTIDKLQQRLEEIHQDCPKFPVVDTMRVTHQKAKQQHKDFQEQVCYMFRELEKQVGKDCLQWETLFRELCKKADYADQVRNRFEAVTEIVDALQDNTALVRVLKKESLDFLDRISLSVWSVKVMNDLLEAFKHQAMPSALVNKVQNDVSSNLLQLLVARVFMEDFSKNISLEAYIHDRENKIAERISKLKNEYHILIHNENSLTEVIKVFDDAMDQIRGTDEFVNCMWNYFVDDFYKKVDNNIDKAWFFGNMVAMGYHTVDFVRRKQGIAASICPNYIYLLSGLDNNQLPENATFAYHDYAHSVDYTNRVYEWLTELNVTKLKALVGNQLILP